MNDDANYDDDELDDFDPDEEGYEEGAQFDLNEIISINKDNVDLVIDAWYTNFPMVDREFFEKFAQAHMDKEMTFATLMEELETAVREEIDKNMQQLVKDGDAEMGVEEETGNVAYWLTPQGEAKAKEYERKIIEQLKKEFPGLAGNDEPKEE